MNPALVFMLGFVAGELALVLAYAIGYGPRALWRKYRDRNLPYSLRRF